MQFNVVPRTGGLAINREKTEEKEGYDSIILTVSKKCPCNPRISGEWVPQQLVRLLWP